MLVSNQVSKLIAKNIQSLRPSATLAINELSKQLENEGKTVYRLGFGQSPFPVPKEVVETLKRYAYIKDYLPVKGLPALRQAVAKFNKRTLNLECFADDILIGPGSKELIYQLQLAIDGILLLPSPSWVSYEPQAQLAQRKVVWLDTNAENNWCLDSSVLEKACEESLDIPKILILNYPNNPTGTTYSTKQLQNLAEVARKYNLIVIADEIYSELQYKGKHVSLAKFYPEGTIISSGLSKWCGAGGWRLGTFTFPKEMKSLLDVMAVIASETFTSVSAPIQYAAVTAFNGSPTLSVYVNRIRQILNVIGFHVHQRLNTMNVTMPPAEGGFYLFPNFENHRSFLAKKNIQNSPQLCKILLEETGIALLPGVAFGRPETELSARLSFVDFDGEKLLQVFEHVPKKLEEVFFKTHFPKIKEAMDVLENWLSEK